MSQSDNHSDIIDYSDFLEILRIPFVGSETEKQNISKQQEDVCLKIITKLKDKTDDEGRESAINAGVAQELSYILESRNLSEVSLPLIEAFDCISFPGDKIDFRPIIYEKYDPFPGILRLIELQNNEMLRVVIKIIGSIINGGISDKYSEHPYYESIISINGGNKIFSLFQRKDVDNNIRNIAAISIGRLFKSQELPETMKQPIIDHLKSITSDQDYWTRSQSILSIDYLAQNEDNYTEIMKGFDKLAVAQDLLLPIIGNDEERKQIQHKKNLDFILLAILLDKEEEDEETILENLIEAGIFEALMYYFETQYLNMISSVSVKILDKIQSQAKELIDLLKQEKKYFPKILHLFGSSDIEVINAVYDLIAYDFAAGADLAEENSPNLLFEEISECGGIEIIFDLFQRNLNQKSRDDATNLLVMLFINQEFSNEKMRREIINFYKNSYINVEKLDLITRSNLIDIAKINGNHTEILKDNFITKAVQAISKTSETFLFDVLELIINNGSQSTFQQIKQEFPVAKIKELYLHEDQDMREKAFLILSRINNLEQMKKLDSYQEMIKNNEQDQQIDLNIHEIMNDVCAAMQEASDNYDEKGGLVLIGIRIIKDIIKKREDVIQQELENGNFIDQIFKLFEIISLPQQIMHEIASILKNLVKISSKAQEQVQKEKFNRQIINLLDSKDENTLFCAIKIITNILLSINNKLEIKQENKVRDVFEKCGGLIKLIQIFQNNNFQNEQIVQYSIISIGLLHKAVKVPDELRFSVIDELKQMSEYKNDKKIIRLSSIVLSMLAECECMR